MSHGRRPRTRRLAGVWLTALLLAFAGALFGVALREFEFSQLNRSYDDVVDELAPVMVGPATVQLRTPSHTLQIHRHAARLVKGTAEGLGAALTLEVSGRGSIEADVSMGSVRTQLNDELTLPRQEISVVGRVSIASGEEGYVIRTLELPASVTVRIESRLARQLFLLCRPMGLVLVNMDCEALEDSLSNVSVPLPAAGSAYVLPYDELTAEERVAFERFLDAP